MDILYLISGIVGGGVATWLIYYFYTKSKYPYSLKDFHAIEDQNRELDINLKLAEGKLNGQEEEV